METFVKIRISSDADLAALRAAGLEIKNVEQAAKSATGTLANLGQGFALGVGAALTTQLAQIPGAIIDATKRGIAFNATLADSEKAVSALIERFQGLSKSSADNAAAAAMAQIVELEPKVAGSLDTLVNGFQVALAASKETGFSISENVEIVGKLANAMGKLRIPLEQFSQEAGSIFSGNITQDSVLAKRLAITPAEVTSAKEAGTLLTLLKDKIGSLGEASDNFATATTSLQSNLDKLRGALTKPIFDELEKGIKAVNASFADPQTQKDIQAWGQVVKDAVGLAKGVGGPLFEIFKAQNPLITAFTSGAGFLKDRAAAKLAIPDKAPPARDFEADPDRTREAGPPGATAKQQAAFIRATSDLDRASAAFAESGRAEASLQAKIEELTKLRESFAKEAGLSADFTADAADTAISAEGGDIATQTRQRETLAEILKLSTEINAEARKKAEADGAALKAEDERRVKALQFIDDLRTAVAIEQARANGNAELVELLENQRALASQIARINESQLNPAEREKAILLARQNAELQKQEALKRKIAAEDAALEDLAVLNAAGGKSRKAKDKAAAGKLQGETFRRLREQGVDEATAKGIASDTGKAEEHRLLRARGGFGGEATPANPGGNKGAINTAGIFDKAKPAMEMFGPPAPPAPMDVFRTATPQVSELFGPPQGPAGGDGGAKTLKGSADNLKQAAQELESAGNDLSDSSDSLSGAASTLQNAAQNITSTADRLGNAVESFTSAFSDLDARVGRLEQYIGQ